MVLGQPAQQLGGLRDVTGVDAGRRILLQLGREPDGCSGHVVPVLHRDPHVGQHRAQPFGDRGALLGLGHLLDLDVQPRLRTASAVVEADEASFTVPQDRHHRVQHQGDRPLLPGELGGDRVDQERHVVGDHLDHRARQRPALLSRGVVHPHDRRAGCAHSGEAEV